MGRNEYWIHGPDLKSYIAQTLTWVPTVMLGIEEMPALDFGFLFLARAFSSIFFL